MTKRTRRGAPAARRGSLASQTDALCQALQAGALAFLPLVDMASVLNSCRLLRFDAELPLLALAHSEIGAHLLLGCASDWMCARPSFLAVPELLDEPNCDVHTRTGRANAGGRDGVWDDVQRFVRAFEASLDPRRGQGAALLSALGMVQQRILPLCYGVDEVNSYGDICTARPVFLPLPLGLRERDAAYEFTNKDIRRALNVAMGGIGDVFIATPQEYNHVSDFGAHWEPTTVATSTRGRSTITSVSCDLCAAAAEAIKTYRKDAKAALKQFNEVLKEKKEAWRAAGCDADEIHQRRSELKTECFPEDSYPDINFAEGADDAILADICESSRFPMDPFAGMWTGFDRFDDDVFNALREEYGAICRACVQPLKRVLTEECVVVGRRVCRSWMGDGEGAVKGELVAGVTRAGFLVGVYVVTRRVE